jgi:hypothetical protein
MGKEQREVRRRCSAGDQPRTGAIAPESLHDHDAFQHVHAASEGDVTGLGGREFDHDRL